MNDPGEDPELQALFIEEMRRHVSACARPSGDDASRARALHSMRGAVAMMGLADLAARLSELESDARAGRLEPGAPDAVIEIDQMLRAAGYAIEGLLVPRPSSRPGPPSKPPSLPPRAADRPSFEPEVLGYFFSEARGRIERLGEAIDAASRPDAPRDWLEEAFRHAHAIKGAASTVGLNSIARGAHALEAAFVALRNRTGPADAPALDAVASAHVHLAASLAQPALAPPEVEKLVALLRAAGLVREHDLRPVSSLPGDRARPSAPADVIRVPTRAVTELVERVGEAGFVGDRVSLHASAVRELARALSAVSRALDDARQRIGPPRPWGAPADALERLADAARAVEHTAGQLDREGERLGHDAEVLGAIAGGARDALARIEASTAAWVFERVAPAAEATARREGKDVIVVRSGDDVELSRGVAEALVEPLSQLARNAVAHGVEAPATRMARGKPARATIRLSAVQRDDRRVFSVEDDGAGVDIDRVRDQATALGLLSAQDARDPRRVLATLFAAGFSTRARADAGAGRGIGLDIAQREVTQLGGTIVIHSRRGVSTRFEVELPARAVSQRMLVVAAGATTVGLPLDRVVRVVASEADAPGASRLTLATVLGLPPSGRSDRGAVVVVRTSRGLRALRVDRVERAREFVVRRLPLLLAGLAPWSAATVDGDGHVMLVLDVDCLVA